MSKVKVEIRNMRRNTKDNGTLAFADVTINDDSVEKGHMIMKRKSDGSVFHSNPQKPGVIKDEKTGKDKTVFFDQVYHLVEATRIAIDAAMLTEWEIFSKK